MPTSKFTPYRPSKPYTARLEACVSACRNREAEQLMKAPPQSVANPPNKRNHHVVAVIAIAILLLFAAWPSFGQEFFDFPMLPPPSPEPSSDAFVQIAALVAMAVALLSALAAMRRIRKRLEKGNEPMAASTHTPSPLQIGGATRTGKVRTENQDAFRLWRFDDNHGVMIVCDGVGGHPGGREAAHFAAEYLLRFLKRGNPDGIALPDLCESALTAVQKAFAELQISGLTTAIVALIDNDRLHYAVLGDGGLTVVHQDGMVQNLLAPHHALGEAENIITAYLSAKQTFTPRIGSVRVEAGGMVLAMTDGTSDLLDMDWVATDRWRLLELIRTRGADQLCVHLLKNIEAARDEETGAVLHSDNMTLAIAAWPEGGEKS